ncbi:DUF167 family protein [Ferroplasma sp.]|uniref:DUF167 domain-containing protein n=1 Tax=Ferroplasma sp. TaxID=2591003 RepID=UPI00307F9A6C
MEIKVRVKEGRNKISVTDGIITVYTKAKRENGQANIDIINQIANYYNIGTSSIKILRGVHSRNKVLTINQE